MLHLRYPRYAPEARIKNLQITIINKFLYQVFCIKRVRYFSLLFFFKKRKGFKFQPYVCNDFHDVLMMSMDLSDIAISKVHDVDYHCIITKIFKSEAVNSCKKII